MKRSIKYIVSIVMAVCILPSCKKFIDYDPQDDYQITAADYFKTADDYQKWPWVLILPYNGFGLM
ncbi:MAG TPA: hypothetical protein PLZ68_00065 [Ferruginibacter sp.]|nr:hypothetical protein [Ferruginibacter sp.]